MKPMAALPIALGAVIGATLIGGRAGPGPHNPRTTAWYLRLRKPEFTPPGPAIGAAWTALDVLLTFAGYRLMTRVSGPRRTRALVGWWATIAGLAVHTWFFFGRRRLDVALGVTGAMLVSSVSTVRDAAQVDRPAAVASLPLVAWVAFASLLNEEVWRRNKARQGVGRSRGWRIA